MMPFSSTSLFYIEADHLSTQSNQGSFFLEHSPKKKREEFSCGKKQSAPDSETKASYFLKISEERRGLGEVFAIITWRGGCSRPEAERRKAAETVKFVKMAQGSWLGKQKFNLALLRGVRQNRGSSSLEL